MKRNNLMVSFSSRTPIHSARFAFLNHTMLDVLFAIFKNGIFICTNRNFIARLAVIAFAALLPQKSKAQWVTVNSGTTENLQEIFFPNSDTGYIVGENGTVLKSSNAGKNWEKLNTGYTLNFNDVFFKNGNEGWIVGDSGCVCHTTTGGNAWKCTFLDSADYINLNAVYAFGSSEILVGGLNLISNSTMFKSNNNGSTWQTAKVQNGIWTVDIKKIGMTSRTTGYAISRGFVLKTTDGGMNWSITDTASVNAFSMFTVLEDIAVFPNNDTLFICGWYPGYFGRSTNGGTKWQHAADFDYYNLDFINPRVGYVGGWGELRKTTDGGLTFTDVSGGRSDLFTEVFSIDFTDEWTGYACGAKGKIIRSNNGGTASNKSLGITTKYSVFPNPTSGLLKLSAPANVKVSNTAGQTVLELNGIQNIDLSEHPNGVYLVTLTDALGNEVLKTKVLKND